MKNEVVEETAYGVGVFEGILKAIPEDVLFDAFHEIVTNGWISTATQIAEIRNMVVTESIRLMTYQEFKDVAPYLFSYPQKQREKEAELIVQMVEITEADYKAFQAAIKELMAIKDKNMEKNETFDHIKATAKWHAEEIERREGVKLSDTLTEFAMSSELNQLNEIAQRQIDYLKSQDLWHVGTVDSYEFGYMPDALIDDLLEDGGYGDERHRQEYEAYFGWFKKDGVASNITIAMPGTSLVDDVILGEIGVGEDLREEIEDGEFDKLIHNLQSIEDSVTKTMDRNNNLSRGR